MPRAALLIVLALPVVATGATVPDLEIEQTVVTVRPLQRFGDPDAARLKQVLQLHGNKGRSAAWRVRAGRPIDAGRPDEHFLIDFRKKLIYEIDDQLKTYFERSYKDADKIEQGAEKVRVRQIRQQPAGAYKAQLIRAYDGKNPSREDLIRELPERTEKERTFRKRMFKTYKLTEDRVTYKVEKTKETRRIAGYACVRYVVTADGEPTENEAWVTTEITVSARVFDFLEQNGMIDRDLVREIRKVRGIPLQYTVQWENGNVSRTVATQVGRNKLPDSLFTHPKTRGYRAQKQKPNRGP